MPTPALSVFDVYPATFAASRLLFCAVEFEEESTLIKRGEGSFLSFKKNTFYVGVWEQKWRNPDCRLSYLSLCSRHSVAFYTLAFYFDTFYVLIARPV